MSCRPGDAAAWPASDALPVPHLRPAAGWRPWAAAALLALLSACAGNTAREVPPPVPTASDRTEDERRARVRLELAGAYYANGQLETALDEVKLALASWPRLAEGYDLRGLIYGAMSEDALAVDSFKRAIEMNTRDGGPLHNLGWFHCQRGRFAEATLAFDAALALPQYRDQARTQLARGVCLARAGQWPEAEAGLMRAYELDPSNPGTGFNLAEVLYRRQNFERARFYINRVNDTPGATNAQTLWLAVRVERRLGNGSAAGVLGQQLRTRFPQSPEATLYDRGRFDD